MVEKYSLFVGCTIIVKLPHIERLAKSIFAELGFELAELDFTCCPTARTVRDVDEKSWLVMAARNLALSEKKGLPILTLCTGCTQTLVEAKRMLDDTQTRRIVNTELGKAGLEFTGAAEVKFFAQLLYENIELIKQRRKKRLNVNVASHSGCHILRPSSILNFDSAENPKRLDELLEAIGCNVIDYSEKTLCCGYQISHVDREASEAMLKDKISSISISGKADCIVVLCPTCMDYLDLRMRPVIQKFSLPQIAVVHYLQLLGLSMGYGLTEVGYMFNKTKCPAIEKI
ncbi:MAG: CoB--CoM heterodisulfide reductase iron-sulfur subunit B family protein [Candidatus Woesearchaeota archaeon]